MNRPEPPPPADGLLLTTKGPTMPLYEHVLLARQDVTSQQVETMIDTYKGVI